MIKSKVLKWEIVSQAKIVKSQNKKIDWIKILDNNRILVLLIHLFPEIININNRIIHFKIINIEI